jgi:hypothetical protein
VISQPFPGYLVTDCPGCHLAGQILASACVPGEVFECEGCGLPVPVPAIPETKEPA